MQRVLFESFYTAYSLDRGSNPVLSASM